MVVTSGGGGDEEKWTDSIAILKIEMSGLAMGVRSKMVPGFWAPCTMDGGIN